VAAHTHTVALTPGQAESLAARLRDGNFEARDVPYAMAAGARPGLSVTIYHKGPKVVVQGKEAEDFVRFVLEPEILGEALLDYATVHDPAMFEPHFGVDESGKGDFLGPLVIAGVFTDEGMTHRLLKAGVVDSKKIGSDKRVRELAAEIRKTPGIATDIVCIGPERYNTLYKKFANVNKLLAWGHARVIEDLCEARPDCPRALSDQFARNPRTVASALMERGRSIRLEQRTKAESDVAVAAASLLARECFIDWMDRTSRDLGIHLAKGGGPAATEAARDVLQKHGEATLARVAKLHFRNASQLTSQSDGR